MSTRPAARGVVPALVVLAALCSACVGLPDDGRIEVGSDGQSTSQDSGFPYHPRPPQPGESPVDIVRHFFDAMWANPSSTSVAREFLTEEAGEAWQPERGMITYRDFDTPTGTSSIRVRLRGANRLDSRGVWQGSAANPALTFPMTTEDAQWRIARAPNAMIVADSWFEDRYRQVSLFFFDPTGQILVPEPVYVPRGGQLATVLMRGLLEGPVTKAPGVAQSFIPAGLSLDELSVPVSAEGVAQVSLRGDISQLDPESVELMTVQMAWTLRQDPSVQRVRVTVGGTPITTSGSGSDFSVDTGQDFDPNGPYSWQDLFGIRNGRLVSSIEGEETRAAGLLGRSAHDLRDLSVDLGSGRVVSVSADGTTAQLTPVEDERNAVLETIATGTDLLKPSWDHADRIWMVDRTSQGAEVSVFAAGRERTVRVPGVTGADVRDFLVSRDGTRFVAVVRRQGTDVIMLSRLARKGPTAVATPARPILNSVEEPMRIRDIAWHSPTEVLATQAISKDLSQVTTLSVDGSSSLQSGSVSSELVRANVVRLVSSPLAGSTAYAVAADGTMYPLASEVDADVPAEGLRIPTYVG